MLQQASEGRGVSLVAAYDRETYIAETGRVLVTPCRPRLGSEAEHDQQPYPLPAPPDRQSDAKHLTVLRGGRIPWRAPLPALAGNRSHPERSSRAVVSLGFTLPTGVNMPKSLRERFFAYVSPEPNSGCWLWDGYCTPTSRPQIHVSGRKRPATHIALELHDRPPPSADLDACHTCDRWFCVNPDHLFWGTHLENMQDALRKGRVRPPPITQIGVDHYLTRLTEADVIAIANSPTPRSDLCEHYQLSLSAVDAIRRGQNWRHLTGFDPAVGRGHPRGEQRRQAKLTTAQVLAITRSIAPESELAAEFGVNHQTINKIRLGLRWSHLTGIQPFNPGCAVGAKHKAAKLTDTLVRLIRAAEGSHEAIAAQFGVARQTVSKVRGRKSWKHVADA